MSQNKQIFGSVTGLDEQSVRFLLKALERSNLPGFDYLEFKQSLNAMADLGMDETLAVKSAFATAATVGLTKDKLLKTAAHYREVLVREKEEFTKALNNQIQSKVHGKRQEIETLQSQIQDWHKQIEALQQKITSAQAIIENADDNIKDAYEKIETTRTSFEHTHTSILNQIDQDIQIIQQNL